MQDSKGRTTGKCILKKESLSELSFRVFNGKDEEGSNRRSYGFSKLIYTEYPGESKGSERSPSLNQEISDINKNISQKLDTNEEEHHVNKDSIMSSRKSDETCMDTQELLRDHVFSAKPVLCESPADNVGCYQLEESTRMESKEFELEVSSNIQGTYNVTPQRVLLESYYNGAIQIFSTGYSSSLHPKNPIQNGEDVGQRKDPLLFLAIPFKKRVSHSINVLNIGDESTEKNI
ncbi:unnamed protein product [Lepeophtheirus salmonis]|uniref:(salmon louse) hypothetical protein n=1 Tax=Lepeophtheirus salmonis TaxID=72036 RepID=A0A7R8H0M8_LEPSM|nr:unnamed protein product [Lepeophtheirus salmonis]CAF2792583.1 unnamed protein product [Lepeophtheirus salmonis]